MCECVPLGQSAVVAGPGRVAQFYFASAASLGIQWTLHSTLTLLIIKADFGSIEGAHECAAADRRRDRYRCGSAHAWRARGRGYIQPADAHSVTPHLRFRCRIYPRFLCRICRHTRGSVLNQSAAACRCASRGACLPTRGYEGKQNKTL